MKQKKQRTPAEQRMIDDAYRLAKHNLDAISAIIRGGEAFRKGYIDPYREQSSQVANHCPRCGSDTFGWDGTIERFDCYKCGFTETEEQNTARIKTL